MLLVVGVLLGMVSSFAVSRLRDVPWVAAWAQSWALLLLAGLLIVVVLLRVWVFVADRAEPRRTWRSDRPPFPGLDAFTEHDAAVFFGRDREVDELVARLRPTLGSS